MTTKHTPGPWWVHREYSTLYVEANAREAGLTQEVAAVGPKEGGNEQQAADAMLIAAAPELLATLRAIAGLDPADTASGSNEWGEAECFQQAQVLARGAVALAEGAQ